MWSFNVQNLSSQGAAAVHTEPIIREFDATGAYTQASGTQSVVFEIVPAYFLVLSSEVSGVAPVKRKRANIFAAV